MKLYCKLCGAPTSYTIEKPNFCSKCGKSFVIDISSASSLPDRESSCDPKTLLEETIENTTLSISELDIEVDRRDWVVQGVKLGAAMGTRDPNIEKENRPQPKGRKPSKKKVQAEFKKEAGTLRDK